MRKTFSSLLLLAMTLFGCSEEEAPLSARINSTSWKLTSHEITSVTRNDLELEPSQFNAVLFPDDTIFSYEELEISFNDNHMKMLYSVGFAPEPEIPRLNPRASSFDYSIQNDILTPKDNSSALFGLIMSIKVVELTQAKLILEVVEKKFSISGTFQITQLESYDRK